MKKARLISSLFILILFINHAYASSYYAEFNQIANNLVVKEVVHLDKKANFEINLPADYSKLDVIGNYSRNGSKLSFYDSSAIVIYATSSYLDNAKKGFYFVKKIIYPENFTNFTMRLNLDRGVFIRNNEAYPTDYNIGTDGETISLTWQRTDVKKGESVPVFVNLEDIKNNQNYIWIWGIIIGIIILAGAYLLYKRFEKIKIKKVAKTKQKNSKKETKEDYDYLLDTEKKVIEELKKADRNELWQKQIQNTTGFSKAKVSRLIRNLEARGLVKKIPFGNTNKVRLK